MAGALIIGGIVMIAVDLLYASGNGIRLLTGRITEHLEEMRPWQAVLDRLMPDPFGRVPGDFPFDVDHRARPDCRDDALRRAGVFVFRLSIPVMATATGYELLRTLHPGKNQPAADLTAVHIDRHGWILLTIGGVVSFIVALFVVAWFMNWVRKRGFVSFGIYRILLGIAVWIWLGRTA